MAGFGDGMGTVRLATWGTKPGGRGSHFLSILARLNAGVTIAQAQAEMTRYAVQTSAATARSRLSKSCCT